uniref:TPM domain-containing protein n=1 Tax=Meloidogyne floridensis TaxID=298350 RepID=A0A915NIT6_9BILA
MISKLIFLIVFIFCLSEGQQISGQTELPNCLNKISSSVCDPNGVLNSTQLRKLRKALVQAEQQTVQEGYSYNASQRSTCGRKGIKVPIVLLKSGNEIEAAETENTLLGSIMQWSLNNNCDRVVVLLQSVSDKVEERRFWAGRNWNVNLEPSEVVELYKNEHPLIQKSDYVEALVNIINAIAKIVSGRNGPARNVKATILSDKPQIASGAEVNNAQN